MDVKDLINMQEKLSDLTFAEKKKSEEDEAFADVNIVQLVSFMIDEVEYGIAILAVHDILRMPEITRLPNTPPFVKGVINLRGNVIPVVDVKKRFGLAKAKIKDSSRIIVIETNDKLVGLLVDHVSQVVRIPENNINPHSELIEGVSEEFIQGIGRLQNRLIIILKLSHLLFDDTNRDFLDQRLV